MLKIKYFLFIVVFGVLLLGCGSDRAGDATKVDGVLGVVLTVETDRDGDGVSNEDEINTYGTNPDSNDTDGDGLLDAEEINVYGTNATNSDTDGDCLLDSFEINVYETNATNPDSDGDGKADGIEIYSYVIGESNMTCLSTPETLAGGYNPNPAIDNIPNDGTDVINALDPNLVIDSDGDGISDEDEINTYGTNPNSNDTDGDGLLDGEEINTYDTNATNPDTDNDGLTDGLEVHTYDTNATNPDTDGDCLLDGFEILNYETNATNADTDGDTINDGIEIYSYVANALNVSCLSTPETLVGGHNASPAKDNIPADGTDVINALDPNNDSDGDGQANSFENNCTEGNASNATELCIFIIDTQIGEALTLHGYAYVPGGFDVDGDGVNEGGFWISRYQARASGVQINSETVIEDVGNVNQYLSKHFKVVNRNIDILHYEEAFLKETGVVAGSELIFDEESVAGIERISHFTPYLAKVCLSRYALTDANGVALDVNITMPTHKQYMHVKMLLDADLVTPNVNGLLGDGRHIRNGVLGIDPNVPLFSYNLIIDEFGEDLKEYVRNLVQLRSTVNTTTFVDTFNFDDDVPTWWAVDRAKFKTFDTGANATQDLGNGIGPEKDAYAVIVRGGSILDVTQGVSGALTDDAGQTNGISFRAATGYLY